MDPATLAHLLAPAPEAEFFDALRRRQLAVWRGRDAARVTRLADWPALERVLEAGAIPAKRVRMTRRGGAIHQAFFVKDGRLDVDRVRTLLDDGASLVIAPLDGCLSQVDSLVADVRSRTRDRVESGVIATTGEGGAFHLHFDPEDLLIVQVEGTKTWRIHETPVPHPVRDMPAVTPPSEGRVLEYMLAAGDVMLVPAGYWHHCENGPGRSIHIGLFLVPPSLPRAAERLVERLLADERTRAPLGRDGSDALDAALVRSKLIDEISKMSLTDFFEPQS